MSVFRRFEIPPCTSVKVEAVPARCDSGSAVPHTFVGSNGQLPVPGPQFLNVAFAEEIPELSETGTIAVMLFVRLCAIVCRNMGRVAKCRTSYTPGQVPEAGRLQRANSAVPRLAPHLTIFDQDISAAKRALDRALGTPKLRP